MIKVDPVAAIKYSHPTQNVSQLEKGRILSYILYMSIICYQQIDNKSIGGGRGNQNPVRPLDLVFSLILGKTTKPVVKQGGTWDQAIQNNTAPEK